MFKTVDLFEDEPNFWIKFWTILVSIFSPKFQDSQNKFHERLAANCLRPQIELKKHEDQ